MIFVVLGTQKFQMNRLLKAIDELIEQNIINEEVVAQTGYSDYVPKNFKCNQFMSQNEFSQYIEQCDLLITHGGVSTIIDGIKHKKAILVCPRLKIYGEHVDDHQIEIVKSFMALGTITCYNDGDSLQQKINEARSLKPKEYISGRDKHISVIREFLSNKVKPRKNKLFF